jgi:hypothetical protein
VGREYEVLIEEELEAPEGSDEEKLALGRAYFQAPEVDGLVVVSGEGLKAGEVVRCLIKESTGLDLSAIKVG